MDIKRDEYSIVMFLSFKFQDAKTRYYVTKREALASLLCIEETR